MTLECAFSIGWSRVPCAALHGQVVVAASLEANKKGFGSSPSKDDHKPKKQKPKQAPSDLADRKGILLKEDSQELRNVIKSVEKGNSKMQARQFKIDKDVAAKGKVDFVKVESWGSADKDQAELDNLKVRSFSPALSFSDHNVPFYERLVRRLELLETKGDMSVVQVKSLPPFQEWIFGEKRYLQYLVDQHAVFETLRNAISSLQNLKSEVFDSSETTTDGSVVMAVAMFDDSLGLNRSQVLWNDIETLSRMMTAKNNGIVSELPKSTTQTTAYVKYLKHFTSLSSDGKGWKRACLQLIAHIFAVYVAHLTTGMRIGAKALDNIPLVKEAKAVSYYRDYPKHISDPLKAFITAVNKVPEFVVAQEDQELIMEELPKAIQKTSLLLSVLAVKEQLDQNEISTKELAV